MKKRLITVGLALLALLTASFLLWPAKFGVCIPYTNSGGSFCSSPLGYPYGVGLLPFSLAFLVLSVLALPTHARTYKRWVVFSIVYFVLAFLLIALLENSSVGMGGFGFSFGDTSTWAPVFSVLYAGISILLLGLSELIVWMKRST